MYVKINKASDFRRSKKSTITDLAIMTGLADSFRDSLRRYIHIDPFTMPDPFTDKDDYDYFVIADKRQSNRVVAMIVINKDLLPEYHGTIYLVYV